MFFDRAIMPPRAPISMRRLQTVMRPSGHFFKYITRIQQNSPFRQM
jgi:hypothetical protein